MTQKGLFERFKHLIYTVLTLAVGISIVNGNESKYYGWCILSISFGFLVTWLAQRVEAKISAKALNVLSFAVPGLVIIYGLVTRQIHFPIF
jgi:hypothetical protein